MDNTLKLFLGVLGFAGVLTFMATVLNTPNTQSESTPAAVAAVPPPPPPAVVETEANGDEAEIADEEDVTSEDIESYGEPTIELPSDDASEQNIANSNSSESQSEGPPPPPPPLI